MAIRPITTTWRGLTVSAEVYSEPDPLSSDGKPLYDVENVEIPCLSGLDVEDFLLQQFGGEIREAILEAVK